MVTDNGALQ